MFEKIPFDVVCRNAAGRERTVRVVASTGTSAATQALLRIKRETGQTDWLAVRTEVVG